MLLTFLTCTAHNDATDTAAQRFKSDVGYMYFDDDDTTFTTQNYFSEPAAPFVHTAIPGPASLKQLEEMESGWGGTGRYVLTSLTIDFFSFFFPPFSESRASFSVAFSAGGISRVLSDFLSGRVCAARAWVYAWALQRSPIVASQSLF